MPKTIIGPLFSFLSLVAPKKQRLFFVLIIIMVSLLGISCQNNNNAPTTEQTMRTTSSTDIQICVEGVLSDERDAMQIVATNTLTVGLASSAVYAVRRYTTGLGATCYLFVYQAPSPDVARKAGVLLAQLLPSATELPLVYKNTQIKVLYYYYYGSLRLAIACYGKPWLAMASHC